MAQSHLFFPPIDVEPLPVEGTVLVSDTSTPPPHDIRLDRETSITDFGDTEEDGRNYAALNRFKALLQRGFRTPDNPESDVPRNTWLVLAAELMVAIHKSIRATHGANPTPRAFNNLDSEELYLFQAIAKVGDSFYDFFDGYKESEDDWSTCLRCLEQCRRPIDRASYESVAMTCGQSITAIHSTVVNEKTRIIHQKAEEWANQQLALIKDAFTQRLVADDILTDDTLFNIDDSRLVNWVNSTAHNIREHTRAALLDQAVDRYVIPWASERLDAATSSILATDGDRIRDLRAEAERRANDDARQFEQDTLAALKLEAEARAKADAYSHYTESLARQKAEAQEAIEAELNTFKHSLRIDTADRKSKAQEAADKAVTAITKYSSKASKGKARHDPIGRRSRAPSVSNSRPPSPTPTPISTNVPLPRTPEAQVISLMEAAPLEITPKAVSFKTPEIASEAMAPIMSIIDDNREARNPHQMFEAMSASIAANTQKQLDAFSAQISTLLAPITNRLADLERDSLAATNLGRDALHPNPTTPSTWGRTDDDDFDMEYTINDAPARALEGDDTDPPPLPFIEAAFRKIHQLPQPTAITHHKVLDDLADMNSWFYSSFYPSYRIEIDLHTEHLPREVETDLLTAYKAWFESGDPVPTAPVPRPPPNARTPRPPAPSPGKPDVGSTALAYATAAGTGRANVTVAGPSAPAVTGPPVRPPSQPPIASLQDFPPIISDWSMPEGHQSGDGFDAAKNPITISSDSDDAGGGWFTTPPPRNRRQRQAAAKRQQSFATAAAAHAAPNPPAAPPAGPELTKADLDKLAKPDIIRTYNQRFRGSMATNTKLSKDAIVASYLAKVNAPPPPPKAPPRPGPTLTTSQYTVVHNPATVGLSKVTSRSHDAPSVVRTLQRALRQQFPAGTKVPVDLIGGRWGAQSSSNFVLIFNGSPGNVAVMQCRKVFHDFFGSDCTIVPQQGYSRVLLRLVPLCRSDSGTLPPPHVLMEEVRRNLLFRDLTFFCPPRWLKADVPETAVHGSVVVTFLDEDGSHTKNIVRSPVFMFGGTARACKFNSLPLLLQCERCWRLGHATRRCPRPKTLLVCSICGGAHPTSEHQFKCKDVKKHSTLKCDCPRSCINCMRESPGSAKGHLSTDHTCPLRAKYRAPLTRTGDSTDEEVHASIPMVVEDPLTFSDEPPATTAPEPARNV